MMCNAINMTIPAWMVFGIGVLLLIGSALNTYATYLRKKIAELQGENK